jgi:hypothetical protein
MRPRRSSFWLVQWFSQNQSSQFNGGTPCCLWLRPKAALGLNALAPVTWTVTMSNPSAETRAVVSIPYRLILLTRSAIPTRLKVAEFDADG